MQNRKVYTEQKAPGTHVYCINAYRASLNFCEDTDRTVDKSKDFAVNEIWL